MGFLEECPHDALAIVKRLLSVMDFSESKFVTPGTPPEGPHLKALLTGLFPGEASPSHRINTEIT